MTKIKKNRPMDFPDDNNILDAHRYIDYEGEYKSIHLDEVGLNLLAKKIASLAIVGLTTNGVHHKQWCLEEILVVLGWDIKKVHEKYGYKKGTPPSTTTR